MRYLRRSFSIFFLSGVFVLGLIVVSPVIAQVANNVSCSAADVNGDRTINIVDLVTIARQFGQRVSGLSEDVNDDGVVNIFDLVLVARRFGTPCTDVIVGDFDGDGCANVQDMVWVAAQRGRNLIDESELFGRLFQSAEHFGEGCNPPVPKLLYSVEADVNGDFVINKGDFDVVTSQFGQSGTGLQGDVDRNGSVGVTDLVLIARRLQTQAPELPDLQVTSVTGYSRDYLEGELVDQDVTVGPWSAVLFTAHVRNAGLVSMPPRYPVRWFVQRVEVQSDGSERSLGVVTSDVPSSWSSALVVGEESGQNDFQFTWIVNPARVVPGTYRFAVAVDYGNRVQEISDDNNTGQFLGRVIVLATRPPLRGDVNKDGEVDTLDINALQRRIRWAMFFDYDGDGSVGAGDALMLEAAIAGTGSVPVEKIKDVDGNSRVDALDVAVLQRSVADLDFDGDGVLGEGDIQALGEIITSGRRSSLEGEQRVVFVPVQEEPAKAQGFASVLRSIFWVIGE